jgi:hypothetical protein
MKKATPNGKSKHHGGVADGKCVFSVRLRKELRDRLQRLADTEERSMAYFVAVFVQQGLDDRNRGARS